MHTMNFPENVSKLIIKILRKFFQKNITFKVRQNFKHKKCKTCSESKWYKTAKQKTGI